MDAPRSRRGARRDRAAVEGRPPARRRCPLDRTAIVYKKPLPYLYAGGRGLPRRRHSVSDVRRAAAGRRTDVGGARSRARRRRVALSRGGARRAAAFAAFRVRIGCYAQVARSARSSPSTRLPIATARCGGAHTRVRQRAGSSAERGTLSRRARAARGGGGRAGSRRSPPAMDAALAVARALAPLTETRAGVGAAVLPARVLDCARAPLAEEDRVRVARAPRPGRRPRHAAVARRRPCRA